MDHGTNSPAIERASRLLEESRKMLVELCAKHQIDVERHLIDEDDPPDVRAKKLAFMEAETKAWLAEIQEQDDDPRMDE